MADANVLRLCGVLYFHFGFGLALVCLGALAIVARFVDRLRPWHRVIGTTWVYGVLMQTATSLYVRKDGFRWFIFAFMMILVINLCIGHACMRIYQEKKAQKNRELRERSANLALDDEEFEGPITDITLMRLRRTHAICMTLAYLMLFGTYARHL